MLSSGNGAAVRIFAIVNQKGGCGKTTTAINLSAVFARRGLRTLLVDMDPQSHCAIGLGVPEQRIERSIADALLDDSSEPLDPSLLVWEVGGNLDLIPSTMRLAGLEAPGGGLHELPDRDRRLGRLLRRFGDRYDRCVIDCPPTIGLLTFNALRAAPEALIPVETGFFAIRGADKQLRTIRQLIERIGRPIACHLVPTLYDADSPLATDLLAALRRQFAGQVLPMVIHEHEVVREATSFGQPVIEYAPQSQVCGDFQRLADWLEDHPPHPGVEIEVLQSPRSRAATAVGHLPLVGTPGSPSAEAPAELRPQSRAAELAKRVRESPYGFRRDPAATSRASPPEGEPKLQFPPVRTPEPAGRKPDSSATEPISQHSPEKATAPGGAALPYGAHPTGRGVRFAQPGDARQSICVAGEFNRWSADSAPLRYDARLRAHHGLIVIPPGRYLYRLVIDGRWQMDPYNAYKQVSDNGELNSVLVVPKPEDLR